MVDETIRFQQRSFQLIKSGRRPAQLLGITAETEVGISGTRDQIRKVFKVQGGQVTGFVADAQFPESHFQVGSLLKPGGFGQPLPAAYQVGNGGIAIL